MSDSLPPHPEDPNASRQPSAPEPSAPSPSAPSPLAPTDPAEAAHPAERETTDAPTVEMDGPASQPAPGVAEAALEDPDTLWRVVGGEAYAFVEHPSAGPRMPLLTLLAGAAAFGMPPLRSLHRIRLVAGAEAYLEPTAIAEAMAETGGRARVAAWIADWVLRLLRALDQREERESDTGLLRQQTLILGGGRRVPRDCRLLWLPPRPPDTADGWGDEADARDPTLGWRPLAREAWTRSAPAGLEAGVTTAEWLARDPQRQGLLHFHREALEQLAYQQSSRAEADQDESQRRRQRDQRLLRSARNALEEAETGEQTRILRQEVEHPLLAALQPLAAALRLPYMALPRERAYTVDAATLITEATGARSRVVRLRPGWYTRPEGPLLGVVAKDDHPVALTPRRGGYDLLDPRQGAPRRVDATVAATLRPEAYELYPPLPRRPLSFGDLLRHALPGSGPDLARVLALGLLGALLSLAAPVATHALVDHLIPGARLDETLWLGLGLTVAALGAAVFLFLRALAMARIRGRVDGRLQPALWDRLLALPARWFQQQSAGAVAAGVFGLGAAQRLLIGTVAGAVLTALFAGVNLILLYLYSPRLMGVAVGVLLLGAGAVWAMAGAQLALHRAWNRHRAATAGRLQQVVAGLPKLRAAGAEARVFSDWAAGFARQQTAFLAAGRWRMATEILLGALPLATAILIYGAFWTLAGDRDLTPGGYLAFHAALGQFLAALVALSQLTEPILRILPAGEAARPLLEPAPEGAGPGRAAPRLRGGIELSRVSFAYGPDAPPVLREVSLRIEPDEFVALVGPSGSGKSTLLRLLLGFESPTRGRVDFDGWDLSHLDPAAVRAQMGVVLQHGRLMQGSLLENIIGGTDATIDHAWRAARLAGLAEEIRALPMGMHTLVDQGGATLSGGQRQRILIARALVREPRVLLFDEATSALDNHAQRHIERNLHEIHATRVVVAHRLSTIRRADRIVVLEAGRIVEEGRFEDLLAAGGVFARLARRQMVDPTPPPPTPTPPTPTPPTQTRPAPTIDEGSTP